jgi:O-antigen ligase
LIEKGLYGGYGIAGIGEKEARVDFLLNTLQVIKDNPIVGSGFTNFNTSQQLIFNGSGEHNAYFSIFAQGGMVIFIPLMAFAFLIYFNSEKGQRLYADSSSKDLGVLLTAIFLSYFVDQFFTPGFFHRHWIWFGFAAAWARNCEMEHQTAAKALRVEATKD